MQQPDLRARCRCGRVIEVVITCGENPDSPRLLEESHHPPSRENPPIDLNPLELAVLSRVALGDTDRETAKSLRVSVGRVRNAVRTAMLRLSARTRSEAVYLLTRQGGIDFIEQTNERPNDEFVRIYELDSGAGSWGRLDT
jgi:DNA-binding CsgD family transcriptional regulator